ncbi:MAG: hypothetical protein KatS3mg047_1425 [Bellilinea sp.]|nr:MAG: hypothetical protein KatS3mg047_1425 [Bellilinea sp.]
MGGEGHPQQHKFYRNQHPSISFSLQSDLLSSNHSVSRPKAGKPCPVCGLGIMDYDGLLNLKCPVCGFGEGGCFT